MRLGIGRRVQGIIGNTFHSRRVLVDYYRGEICFRDNRQGRKVGQR